MRDLILTLTTTLKLVLNCDVLGLEESFCGICFGYAFSLNIPISKGLKYTSIKVVQENLQKCITWPKSLRKGKQEWNKTCVNSNLPERKLNTQVKAR